MVLATEPSEELGMDGEELEAAWSSLERASEAREFGGAVSLIFRYGKPALSRSTGWAVREPENERTPMSPDTMFDLASLTKVIATTPLVLKLIADGAIGIDQPVGEILPEFGIDGAKVNVTIRRLMTHSAGMIAWRGVFTEGVGAGAYLASFARDQPEMTPGEQVVYSCAGFILLGEVVRRSMGASIAVAAREHVFEPLGMTDTMFTPPPALRERIAATELGNIHETSMAGASPVGSSWRDYLLRGEVHDGNAWYGFQGISGNAGLFGTATDLARYGQMWLNGGELDGTRILPEELVREAITEQTGLEAPNDRRGLGWQMAPRPDEDPGNHSGRGLSQQAFGHTGFTGTSLWMDPERELVIVLLTNRVHPTVSPAFLPTRALYTEAIAGACK